MHQVPYSRKQQHKDIELSGAPSKEADTDNTGEDCNRLAPRDRAESSDQQQAPLSFTTTSLVSDSESKITSRDSREYSTGLRASKISSSCSSFANVSTSLCKSLADPSNRSIPSFRYEVIDYNSLDCTPDDEAYVCFPANLVQCNGPCELIEQVRFHQISYAICQLQGSVTYQLHRSGKRKPCLYLASRTIRPLRGTIPVRL